MTLKSAAMRKLLMLRLSVLLLISPAACDGVAESQTEVPAPAAATTAVPATQAPPTATSEAMQEEPTATSPSDAGGL